MGYWSLPGTLSGQGQRMFTKDVGALYRYIIAFQGRADESMYCSAQSTMRCAAVQCSSVPFSAVLYLVNLISIPNTQRVEISNF